ncbi:MAG TPA: hypothetical protein VFO76_07955 [Candidatus Kapabacteria bacterium]|nr:hypothetical protein [Candidatus Kapabacteria bacterium]
MKAVCRYSLITVLVVLLGCAKGSKPVADEQSSASEQAIATTGNHSSYALSVEHTDSLPSTPASAPTESPVTKRETLIRRAPVMRGGDDESPAPTPKKKTVTTASTETKSEWNQPFKFNLKDTTFLLFTADTVMNMEQTYDVFLSIYTDKGDSNEAQKNFDSGDKNVKRINDTLFYLPDYKATLHGNGFRIIQVTDSVQHLYKHAVTTWNWQVVPESGGTLKLTVVVAGFNAAAEGTLSPKDHFFIRPIKVRVTGFHMVKEFAVSNYGYAAYTSILAGIGWYVQNRRKKKKQAGDTAPSEKSEE